MTNLAADRLTIVSFDRSRDAAKAEQQEDRSLNLILRQRRVRSEIFRLSLSPDGDQLDLLAEILANGPKRPIVFLAREIEAHAGQRQAIARLAPYGTEVTVVLIGSPLQAWDDLRIQADWLNLPADGADEMSALAERLTAP